MKKALLFLIIIQMSFYSYAQWNNIYHDSILFEVHDLYFFNQDTGLVCGTIMDGGTYKGFIMKTEDGGENWEPTTSEIMICYSIDFINDSIGFSGGQDGVVYKTIDGGVTWNYLSNVGFTADFEDLEFINDSIGFIKIYSGFISKTIDGGLTWTAVSESIISDFYERKHNSIHFLNESIGFVVGMGSIYKTIDQGENWQKQNADSTKYYKALYMLNENEGFAVGNDGILSHSQDGGTNWTNASICNQDLRDIDFISDSIGFIVGGGHDGYNDSTGIVLRTKDKGNSWDIISISTTRLNSFQHIDSIAYTTGNYGNIFKNENYSNLVDVNEFTTTSTDLRLWPNPAINDVNFNIPNGNQIDIELIDLNGNTVLSYQNYSKNKVNLSNIRSGIYFLKITNNKDVSIRKVIKY